MSQMARTKEPARRVNSNKRPHDAPKKQHEGGPPPSKKARKNPPSSTSLETPKPSNTNTTSAQPQLQSPSENPPPASQSSNAAPLPPSQADLAKTHDVTTQSIISSSHIQQKVTRVLEILSVYPTPANEKPRVVMLHAKAACASKMISIAEIAKREIAREGGSGLATVLLRG
ncbi:hypothetical protein D0Z07_7761 [Hyphodiscus hymeniophilus]|uniref:DNA/RNA-binding protein Alba-like domain-containing protein n=1 Tax=Hyphodiscus hymeniophilus TaxID=353542 RepID=A0A9P6SPW1_9HELO|nr:hypothetical protein D0Z07_7761 [Hyphodiscus hymeniophilus]